MHRPFPLLLLAIALGIAARSEAVAYSKGEIDGKTITVCKVNVREERLELFLRDEAGQGLKSFSAIDAWLATRGQKLIFGINAGMFHPDYSPVGLFISEGKDVKALNTDSAPGNFFLKPNGVFAITESGAHVVETSEYPKLRGKVRLATQSGPLLVQRGKLHPAFKAGSESRLFRNGVGVPKPGTAIFAISDSAVNFDEFARFFRDVLHCPDALFLDGTICSLHSPELKRSDKIIDLGPVLGIAAPR
jgi:uncharacterized protein YigE (DUF2233 family)